MQGKEGTAVLETIQSSQSASTVSPPLNPTLPASLPVCGVVCVCCVPSTLRSCIPPPSPSCPPPSSSPHPSLYLPTSALSCLSCPAFPCFFLILIAPNSGGFLRHVFSRVGVGTCAHVLPSSPPSTLETTCIDPLRRLCLFEKLTAPIDGPNGWRPGTPNMQALKLPALLAHAPYVRCSCSSCPSPMCQPSTHPPFHVLVQDPPRSHSLPTPAVVHRAHLTCPPDSPQGSHWIAERGSD